MNAKLTQTILSVSDLQYPFLDRPVWQATLDFARTLRPNAVVVNGDGIDFEMFGKYLKDPAVQVKTQEHLDGFQDEVLSPLGQATPRATKRIFTEGNHERRVQKYLWREAPALSSLRGLEVDKLLRLADHRIVYMQDPVFFGDHLAVMHGHLIRKHSAATARAHFERHGTSMVIGHTHRIGVYMVRDLRGVHEVTEQGCLCDLDPEWDDFPNWQQGFAVIHVFSDGTFSTQVVKVVNRAFLLYGRERVDIHA